MTDNSDFFLAAERRFHAIAEYETSFSVSICGRTLVFHFQNREQAEQRKAALTGLIIEENGDAPDAEFFYWIDDPDCYIPEKDMGTKGVWISEDDTGSFLVISDYGLIGSDHKRGRYYHCLTVEQDGYDRLGNHPMIVPLLRWALDSGMTVMHCAAVGVNGKGVLICGRGGHGKSTLAISCMALGMDFVSDDYVLLSQSAPLKAMPIYRTVGMNPDMEALLKPALPILRKEEGERGKLLLDASSVQFCSELDIQAVIFPVLDKATEIVPAMPGKAFVQMIHSTISQLHVFHNVKINRIMMQSLAGLPVYEMHLGGDLLENAQLLRNFLL